MLENTYERLPSHFYQKVNTAKFSKPELLIFNDTLATKLGINPSNFSEHELAQIFSGQTLLPGSSPMALAYAGHQFGHPVPQLGDGRAHLLGEISGHDIQLKGSGTTRFSRRGDGRSALGPVIREYIVSEAMHALGVPTTRALCAVSTGESVLRQFGPEPGGVFTRVAKSHLRVGSFQYFLFQNDIEGLHTLFDYAVRRHYPELLDTDDMNERCIGFLKLIATAQADLISKWSAFGFIHGVMNTDNFSIAGITIDFGPCAFMDEFSYNKVFSSIDRNGRYAFFNQTEIAKWNLCRLAECLFLLMEGEEQMVTSLLQAEIEALFPVFEKRRVEAFAMKFGIENYNDSDEELIMRFLDYLEEHELDFTLSFRALPELFKEDFSSFVDCDELRSWLVSWKERNPNIDSLDSINPLYIPRNHLVEKAIGLAYEGDVSFAKKMNKILTKPFESQDGALEFSQAPTQDERVQHTYCGT